MLRKGQDITAMALNSDNTNLVVSTADKQLLVFTDPSVNLPPLSYPFMVPSLEFLTKIILLPEFMIETKI
jgi:hypothetical protein